mmetsp:Transcript_12400/g.30912  ORF Transcript_12400/g.30912 Transcript_12400/m.30912 type:complete len:165 (+) Transcript_12400:730-1224(+)
MVARPAGGVGAVVARAAVRKVMEAAEEGSGECWDWAEGLVVSMVAGSSVAKVAAVAVAVVEGKVVVLGVNMAEAILEEGANIPLEEPEEGVEASLERAAAVPVAVMVVGTEVVGWEEAMEEVEEAALLAVVGTEVVEAAVTVVWREAEARVMVEARVAVALELR